MQHNFPLPSPKASNFSVCIYFLPRFILAFSANKLNLDKDLHLKLAAANRTYSHFSPTDYSWLSEEGSACDEGGCVCKPNFVYFSTVYAWSQFSSLQKINSKICC